jgi:hypothetical protein
MSNPQQSEDGFIKRYLALRALRDNIYYTHPTKFSLLDIAEDLPEGLRGVGAPLKEVLPSNAIISRDPIQRKQQVEEAASKIRATGEGKKEIGNQALANAARLGLIGFPVGLLTSAALRIIGLRSPLNNGKLRVPMNLKENVTKLVSQNPEYRSHIASKALGDATKTTVLAGAGGALTPLVSGTFNPSDNDLNAAAKIMEEHPYSTALPGGELAAVSNSYQEKPDPYVGTAIGAIGGAGMGAAGTAIPPVFESMDHILPAIKGHNLPPISELTSPFINAAKKSLARNSLILGGVGALGGYLASRPTDPTQSDV